MSPASLVLSFFACALTVTVDGPYFNPRGGAQEAVVRELDSAKREVRVLAYSFTSAAIANALAAAKARGVDVQITADRSNRTGKYSAATYSTNAGIPTFIDAEHAIAHNKVMIIDGGTVITGSFIFTNAAEERNAENLLVLRAGALAEKYLENWRVHRAHSTAFERRQ